MRWAEVICWVPGDDYRFKVPQLCNLKDLPFYGHGGTFGSVYEVVQYKNEAQAEKEAVPDSQLDSAFCPLELSEEEVQQLTDFIENGITRPLTEALYSGSVALGAIFPK